MKKLLGIVILGLLLSSCVGSEHESGTLAAVIGFFAIIIISLVMAPSMWIMDKAQYTKNKYLSLTLWVISIGSIIFIMFNYLTNFLSRDKRIFRIHNNKAI